MHRAKIFAPFDALAGFGNCIASKEIQYCSRRDLSEWEREEPDRKIDSDSKTIRMDETFMSVESISDISEDLFETLDDVIP